ncbi:DUF2093 domain-containing protein [Croceicoccus sp. F390]|uniref:DUF2093 domain-containing protein n=1 Tax=Croceicoccus esteveae TaxID=3075597 RepID=A0ABU2ZIM6_9SPHN|nr:DUF2093 domain-containing protein [Croceicoccus sp. F390]MDT0575429.1 DUF2093 domain-containing protein [Croceicoccus sp. F390]
MFKTDDSKAARLRYGPNGFRQLTAGDHVLCAVSGAMIPLEMLRYWSVDRQEPYASAQIATKALHKS